jgi:hypothetical protein
MRIPLITQWGRAGLAVTLLALAALGASAANPKRVLLLDPFGRNAAPFAAVVSSFRTTLARELGEPVDLYELPLELARFAGPEGEDQLVTFLEGRLKEQPVDLVVPVGGAGVQFAVRHLGRLFPTTSVLMLGAEQRIVSPALMGTNATLVSHKVSLQGMVQDILQIQPRTTNIVVVFGASALERFWAELCRREFQDFTNRVGFTWVNDLTLEQILKHCAALPPKSFVLHALFVVDAAGVPCERNEALLRLHEVANAPLFGYYVSEFGLGSIGGRLFRDTDLGTEGARVAVRILRGESPGNIPARVLEATAPTYDWRELRRWGVSEARLPAGSLVLFRQQGFWERYWWLVSGAVLFCLLQAALIVGLLVNRAQRRQREAEAALIAEISSKFVNLPPGEVDREILDAQRRFCQALNIDVAALWQWSDGAPGFFTLTHLYSAMDGPQSSERINSNNGFSLGPTADAGWPYRGLFFAGGTAAGGRSGPGVLPQDGHQVESDDPALGRRGARCRRARPQHVAGSALLAGPNGEAATIGGGDLRQCAGSETHRPGLARGEREDDSSGRRGAIWRLGVAHRRQPDLGLGKMAAPVRVRNRSGPQF